MTEKALRYNKGKCRLHLIPWEVIMELGWIFTKGAVKYTDDNWKSSLNTFDHDAFVKDRTDSLLRHLMAFLKGEWFDEDFPEVVQNLPKTTHLGSVIWNAGVIFWYEKNRTSAPPTLPDHIMPPDRGESPNLNIENKKGTIV